MIKQTNGPNQKKSLKALLILISVFLIMSCSNHQRISGTSTTRKTYFLQGKIEGRDSGMVYLGMYDTTELGPLIIFDSAIISDSNFHFQGELPRPLICKLKIPEEHYIWPYTHYFVLDTGVTMARLFKDSMPNSVIIGSSLNEKLLAFNKELIALELAFEKSFVLNRRGIISDDSLSVLEKEFVHSKYNLILDQVQSNPTSITSAFIAKKILTDVIDQTRLQDIADALSSADNYFARLITSELALRRRAEVGTEAPSFKVTDDQNKIFTNDSFIGSYLLLDFWASWCPPCREESPNLVKAYNIFSDKGLQMISISVDVDKSAWEKAVIEDNFSWIQVRAGPRSKICDDFGIYFFPSNILIDPNGKIVAKNVAGIDLKKTLDFWLEKK